MIKTALGFAAVVLGVAYLAPRYLDSTAPAPVEAPARSAAAKPQAPVSSGGGRFRVAADTSGHFLVDARIDGRNVDALVDTGATVVALRYEDARDMGLIRPTDDFDMRVSTANGVARARRVQLSSVRVGPITVSGVDALVAEPGALGVNLLGMTFLRRLGRFEVSDGVLLLER